ncbi:MAG: ATP-binding protein [Candidatus Hydrogenedentota bacterium]
MRIASKFIFTMIVILIAIRSFEGVMTVQRESYRLEADIQRDAALIGGIIRTSVSNAWLESGQTQALNMLDKFNLKEHPVHISWKPKEGEDGLQSRLDSKALNKLEKGEMVSLRERREKRGEVQYFYVPLDVPGADGAIQLAETLEERSRYVRHAWVRELFAGAIAVVVNGALMLLLGYLVIGRPLDQLRERINAIGNGNLTQRIHLRGHNELTTLADGLNDMCAKLSASRKRELAETEKRLEAIEQMRHMDRLTTIGRLASGVAHELGTPLNVIGGRAGMILDGTVPAESQQIQEMAATIKTQTERMTSIIQRLLHFARHRPPKRVKANAIDIVRQAAELVDCLGYKATIRTDIHGPYSSLGAEMDPVQMQQVMTNLIDNALQAMPGGGEVVVGIRSVIAQPPAGTEAGQDRFLQITVKDTGGGISEENLHRIFDPFFTTKDVGRGTGLGLSITYGIVREHHGWIDVESEVGKGSCFTIYIPQENTECTDAS